MPSAPWEDSLASALKDGFGDGVEEALVLGGQKRLTVSLAASHDILTSLKSDHGFDYLVDVTAVHWPKRERQFDIVWILYSFAKNERIRVKTTAAEGESAPSVTGLYHSADWLEREAFDMFGVRFEGHADLRRILMPDEWDGHPLRKDYGILDQDRAWVRENLEIESAQ